MADLKVKFFLVRVLRYQKDGLDRAELQAGFIGRRPTKRMNYPYYYYRRKKEDIHIITWRTNWCVKKLCCSVKLKGRKNGSKITAKLFVASHQWSSYYMRFFYVMPLPSTPLVRTQTCYLLKHRAKEKLKSKTKKERKQAKTKFVPSGRKPQDRIGCTNKVGWVRTGWVSSCRSADKIVWKKFKESSCPLMAICIFTSQLRAYIDTILTKWADDEQFQLYGIDGMDWYNLQKRWPVTAGNRLGGQLKLANQNHWGVCAAKLHRSNFTRPVRKLESSPLTKPILGKPNPY